MDDEAYVVGFITTIIDYCFQIAASPRKLLTCTFCNPIQQIKNNSFAFLAFLCAFA